MQIWTCVQQILAEKGWRVSLFCCSQSQNRDTFQAYSAEMSCNSESARSPVLKQLEKLDLCSMVASLTNIGVLQLLAKSSATHADPDLTATNISGEGLEGFPVLQFSVSAQGDFPVLLC